MAGFGRNFLAFCLFLSLMVAPAVAHHSYYSNRRPPYTYRYRTRRAPSPQQEKKDLQKIGQGYCDNVMNGKDCDKVSVEEQPAANPNQRDTEVNVKVDGIVVVTLFPGADGKCRVNTISTAFGTASANGDDANLRASTAGLGFVKKVKCPENGGLVGEPVFVARYKGEASAKKDKTGCRPRSNAETAAAGSLGGSETGAAATANAECDFDPTPAQKQAGPSAFTSTAALTNILGIPIIMPVGTVDTTSTVLEPGQEFEATSGAEAEAVTIDADK